MDLTTLEGLSGVAFVIEHLTYIIVAMHNNYWMKYSGHIPFYADEKPIVLYNVENPTYHLKD